MCNNSSNDMLNNNFSKLAAELEKQELEAPKGAPAHVYSQLLAIYLYQNDLCNAKYLWKRIPQSVENTNAELFAIWSVGQKMWKRDLPGTYQSLSAFTWSEPVAKIMNSLEDKVRERAITLIAQAYSSLSIETMMSMTGLSNERAIQVCQNRGWEIQDGGKMIIPHKPPTPISTQTSSEDQLYKLTEFVSFLEI